LVRELGCHTHLGEPIPSSRARAVRDGGLGDPESSNRHGRGTLNGRELQIHKLNLVARAFDLHLNLEETLLDERPPIGELGCHGEELTTP
jgi:hypothetical protein